MKLVIIGHPGLGLNIQSLAPLLACCELRTRREAPSIKLSIDAIPDFDMGDTSLEPAPKEPWRRGRPLQ